jgi:hypothetical protein
MDWLIPVSCIVVALTLGLMPDRVWRHLGNRLDGVRAAWRERRRGPWIQTRSGARWYPYTPRPADVQLEDLGACAYVMRWGGHAGAITVAEHQYRVARLLAAKGESPLVQLLGALHDAHEVYPPGDVAGPVHDPRGFLGYVVWWGINYMSRRAEVAVRRRLHLPFFLPRAVREADRALLSSEAHCLLQGGPKGWGATLPEPRPLPIPWSPEVAERRWWQLVAGLAERAAGEMKDERSLAAMAGQDTSQGWDTITALYELAAVANRMAERCALVRRGAA